MASFKNGNGERCPRKFLPKFSDRVPNGSHFYGWVSHVEDPFHFYVKLETGETQKLRYLLAELQEESPLAKPLYRAFQGLACAAKLDGQWGRALLEQYQPGSDNGEVFFVDSGQRKVVKILDLKSLDDRFMTLPAQAVLCHLGMIVTNVKNLNAPWSDESCKFFQELVEECFVNIFTVGGFIGGVGCMPPIRESKLYVTMYLGDEKKSVNTTLSQAGHGQLNNIQEHAWHETKRIPFKSLANPANNGCKMKTSKSDVKQPELPQDDRAQPFDSSTSSLQPQKQQQHSLIFKEEYPKYSTGMPPISIDVTVSHVIDPGKFYVRHQSYETYNQYQTLFNKTGPGLERPWDIKYDGFFLVFDESSKRWYRAKYLKSTECTTVQSEKMFDFYLIDEGFNVRVPRTAIRELNEELKSIRPMVWECSLDMDSPKNGWTQPMIDYFKNWIRREKCKLTVLSIQDSVRKVDLAQIPSSPNEKVEESAIKSLRGCGIVKEGASKAESSASRPSSSLEMVESSKAKYVTNLHKLNNGSCVKGQVIQITDPGEFYIRIDNIEDGDSSTFNFKFAQLQKEYNELDDVDIGIPWKGFPYIVRHQGSWHRALVEDVVDSEQIAVFLVDSGLRLNITAADVRHIREKYMNYPVQVVKCSLFGICSKNPSGLWSLENKNFFKQMVTEVRLDIYVERSILGGIGKSQEEESLLCVVLYAEGKDSSVNTRLTRSGHGISVRQHDLPSHNRPKTSIVNKSTSDLTLPMDDIDLLISGFNKPDGTASKAKGGVPLKKPDIPMRPASASSPGLDIDDLIKGIRPPMTRVDDIDLLINGLGIRSSIISQSMPNLIEKEQPQENANLKDRTASNKNEGPSWKPIAVDVLASVEKPIAAKSIPDQSRKEESQGKAEMTENSFAVTNQEVSWKLPLYQSANSTEPNDDKTKSEVAVKSRKPSISLQPTKGFSAGDVLAAEVALLECCYQAIGLDGSLKTEGQMPREGDYIVAVKLLMCRSTQTIFVRPIIYESKFEDMNIELQKAYRTSKVGKMAHVEVGNRCAAFVYGQWIRAVITDIDADLRCSIASIDCGQPHVIPFDQIYSLISPFDSIPKFALKCSLLGVKPDNGSPNDEITAKITNALLQADDVYVFCSHRPKAIPSLLEVNIIYRHETVNGVVLTNLKDWLVV